MRLIFQIDTAQSQVRCNPHIVMLILDSASDNSISKFAYVIFFCNINDFICLNIIYIQSVITSTDPYTAVLLVQIKIVYI